MNWQFGVLFIGCVTSFSHTHYVFFFSEFFVNSGFNSGLMIALHLLIHPDIFVQFS